MFISTQVIGGRQTRYEFCDAAHDLPANQDPQSQVLDIGPEPRAGEIRDLLIGITFVTSSGVEPDTLTVDGVAATRIAGQAPTGAFTVGQAFWLIRKQAGTTATIAFGVPSGDIDGGMIAIWALYNLKSSTPVDVHAEPAFGAGTTDISVDTLADGFVAAIASMSNTGSRSVDWVGVTEVSANETTNDQQWAASALNVAAASPRTVQASWLAPGAFSVSAIAVSFR